MSQQEFNKPPLTFVKLLPSILTLVGLSIGISSIRFAIEQKWEKAVICIIVAMVIDGFDGRLARMLNATSRFGAELDSLCDFANFGIAPAFIIYYWSLYQYKIKLIAWGVVLFYIICMAIRLARFNLDIVPNSTKQNHNSNHFFTGVPAPSGAMLALVPVILEFKMANIIDISIKDYIFSTMVYLTIVGLLMASRIPTISLKNISIKPEYLWIVLVSSAMVIISLILIPWYTIPAIALAYLIAIPITATMAKRIN